MQFLQGATDNPFAVLSFLAAPAILTNASTLLALSTSNRLARAADRARSAAAMVLASKPAEQVLIDLNEKDFQVATRRAAMLVEALRAFYLAAGSFAAGTCVALLGAFAAYFGVSWMVLVAQVGTIVIAMVGVGALVSGALKLVAETRLALSVLEDHHAAITTWRATRKFTEPPLGG